MNRTLIGLAGAGLLAAVVAGTVTVAAAGWGPTSGPGIGWGMMGGPGMMNRAGTSSGSTATCPYGNSTGARGMMGGGAGMTGIGPWSGVTTGTSVTTLDGARQAVQTYINQLGNPNLAIDEVMQFRQNFYAIVKDSSTGHGAFELLVAKNGWVGLEYGPARMWNTEYGHMRLQQSGAMTISVEKAKQIAQTWLNSNIPGTTVETPDQFPGYYTVHFLKNGTMAGMLSVNGYTGQVWYHSWHGAFVA